MTRPALPASHRRPAACGLALLALAQAAIAAAFAAHIGATLDGAQGSFGSLALLVALVVAAGAAIASERWIAERFAQSFVTDCRAALSACVIRHRGRGGDARWLSGLVGDMAAIRNFAVRGSVKLVTTALSGGLAMIWLMLAYPTMAIAGVPLLVALVLLIPATRRLSAAIGGQRRERGRLNRFLIRRVRIALSGADAPNGHGKRKLMTLSEELARHAIARARWVGALEAVAISGGMASSLLLVDAAAGVAGGEVLAAFALVGFSSARLLEAVRALHARIGGIVSLNRLETLLARPRSPLDEGQRTNAHD